ncbi:MAG: IclR family transcriptional regulator [Anaerolineae bacterium]
MPSTSAHKVLDILLCFSVDVPERTVDELEQLTHIPTSTIYRYIKVLVDKGFIEKAEGSSYRLGLRFFELSRAARNSNRDLRLSALPSMKRIADQIVETVSLMRIFDRHAVCIESIEGQQVVRVTIEQGRMQPLYAGASSKVLLASLSEDEWDNYLPEVVKPLTPATITDRERFKAELYQVREQGYAISDGEIDAGGRAISVPILNLQGKTVAALSIEGPYFRMTDDVIAEYLTYLQQESQVIRRSLS